jgi:hypothetical protein
MATMNRASAGGDTGIHPSAAGYLQMASQVPPPG